MPTVLPASESAAAALPCDCFALLLPCCLWLLQTLSASSGRGWVRRSAATCTASWTAPDGSRGARATCSASPPATEAESGIAALGVAHSLHRLAPECPRLHQGLRTTCKEGCSHLLRSSARSSWRGRPAAAGDSRGSRSGSSGRCIRDGGMGGVEQLIVSQHIRHIPQPHVFS